MNAGFIQWQLCIAQYINKSHAVNKMPYNAFDAFIYTTHNSVRFKDRNIRSRTTADRIRMNEQCFNICHLWSNVYVYSTYSIFSHSYFLLDRSLTFFHIVYDSISVKRNPMTLEILWKMINSRFKLIIKIVQEYNSIYLTTLSLHTHITRLYEVCVWSSKSIWDNLLPRTKILQWNSNILH